MLSSGYTRLIGAFVEVEGLVVEPFAGSYKLTRIVAVVVDMLART